MFHRMVGQRMEADMGEFEDAREVVAALSEEYAAAESSDYVRGRPGVPGACCWARRRFLGVCVVRASGVASAQRCTGAERAPRPVRAHMLLLCLPCSPQLLSSQASCLTQSSSFASRPHADRPCRRRRVRPGNAAGKRHAPGQRPGRPACAGARVSQAATLAAPPCAAHHSCCAGSSSCPTSCPTAIPCVAHQLVAKRKSSLQHVQSKRRSPQHAREGRRDTAMMALMCDTVLPHRPLRHAVTVQHQVCRVGRRGGGGSDGCTLKLQMQDAAAAAAAAARTRTLHCLQPRQPWCTHPLRPRSCPTGHPCAPPPAPPCQHPRPAHRPSALPSAQPCAPLRPRSCATGHHWAPSTSSAGTGVCCGSWEGRGRAGREQGGFLKGAVVQPRPHRVLPLARSTACSGRAPWGGLF